MPDAPLLGSFEQIVLLAVARLGADAYGMRVRRDLSERTGRDVNIGAVYATLSRMEAKGLVGVAESAGGSDRGGRMRKTYHLLPAGVAALRSAHRTAAAMWDGIDPDRLEEYVGG